MYYETSLVVPAGTAEVDPAGTTLVLVPGTVDRVEIGFWAGARGNLHVRIKEGEHVVWPTNPGAWFTAEDHVIVFNENYELTEPPYALTIEGYNLDPDYDHEAVVRFGINTGKWSVADLVSMLTVPREVV